MGPAASLKSGSVKTAAPPEQVKAGIENAALDPAPLEETVKMVETAANMPPGSELPNRESVDKDKKSAPTIQKLDLDKLNKKTNQRTA